MNVDIGGMPSGRNNSFGKLYGCFYTPSSGRKVWLIMSLAAGPNPKGKTD